jgi:glyoxylase-like metal-dependent hydrolase (beta-lactamase superfamily II)
VRADRAIDVRQTLETVGAIVFERGWLSSNNVLFRRCGAVPATLIDSGYHAHASLTVELVRRGLYGEPLGRVVNTHLHSDHCGGNAALQVEWGCETLVPQASLAMAQLWDEAALSYLRSGQTCPRFAVDAGVAPGAALQLGNREWQVHAAPGHDPLALMFFEPENRVLIAGDALWENGLAIIFPELEGVEGFAQTEEALAQIEALEPADVVPGHGPPFGSVQAALRQSRQRLRAFKADPSKHLDYAARALVMFHMLEARRATRSEVANWMASTPLMSAMNVDDVIGRLIRRGALQSDGDSFVLASNNEV